MSVYATADLHGRLDLFRLMQSYLKENDILYIIGDVIDRGPDSWKLFKEVMKDPRCKLLKGNHEDMCFRAMSDVKYGNYQDYIPDWFNNDGNITFDQILADEHGFSIYPLMGSLITQTEYINKDNIKIILNHSGFYQDEGFPREYDLLWDRIQYKTDFAKGWRGPEDVIVVHGHTPIPFMIEDMQETAWLYQKEVPKYDCGAFWYADNHKINLDTGACWTGIAVMLDLDTFDEHIFQGEPMNG